MFYKTPLRNKPFMRIASIVHLTDSYDRYVLKPDLIMNTVGYAFPPDGVYQTVSLIFCTNG